LDDVTDAAEVDGFEVVLVIGGLKTTTTTKNTTTKKVSGKILVENGQKKILYALYRKQPKIDKKRPKVDLGVSVCSKKLNSGNAEQK
jgi:hypothetical protein